MTQKDVRIFGCSTALALAVLLVLAGCSQPVEEPPEPELEPEPVPVTAVEPEPEPAPPEPEPSVDAEPNWKDLFADYKAEYAQEFQPRQAGETVQLRLKQKREPVTGKLVAVEESQVLLEVAVGQVAYQRALLDPATRTMLYGDDYAHLKALNRVKAEQAEYDREQRRLAEIARQKELAARPKPKPVQPGGRPAASLLNHTKPVVNPNDGAVLQVKEYLQANTRNANTLRYLQWGKLQKDKEGFKVTCVYKVRSDEFGDATESKYFFMNKYGTVLRTAAFRGVHAQ